MHDYFRQDHQFIKPSCSEYLYSIKSHLESMEFEIQPDEVDYRKLGKQHQSIDYVLDTQMVEVNEQGKILLK